MKRLIMLLLLVALAIPATAFAAPFGSSGARYVHVHDECQDQDRVARRRLHHRHDHRRAGRLDARRQGLHDHGRRRARRGVVRRRGRPERRRCDERQEPQDRGRCPEQLRRHLQRRRLHERGRLDQERHAQQHRADDRLSVRARDRRLEHRRGSTRGGQSRSRTTSSRPTTRTGSTCAATSMRRSSGTPSRAKGRSTTSPRTASSSRGRHGRAGRGQHGQRERLHAPAGTDATGILVIDATVSIDRKNTLSGNEVDILNAAAPSAARSTAPNNKGRGVATPTPDSPARQLMHREARSGGPLCVRARRRHPAPGSATLP